MRFDSSGRRAGYPRSPRRNYSDLKGWLLPGTLVTPISTFLLWLYAFAEQSCAMFGSFIYTVSGCCIILFLVANVFSVVCFMRLHAPLTTLMSSFYNSLGAFTAFMLFFLLLVAMFARMFQSSFTFSGTDASSNATRPDTLPEFFKAFYTTFLVSLNVLDANKFYPDNDRIDLDVTHLLFIPFFPVLFINFVVGILSSVVNQVIEHDIENRYILMLSAADFSECTFFFVRKLSNRLFGTRPVRLELHKALGPSSKLIEFNEDTLDSLTASAAGELDEVFFDAFDDEGKRTSTAPVNG